MYVAPPRADAYFAELLCVASRLGRGALIKSIMWAGGRRRFISYGTMEVLLRWKVELGVEWKRLREEKALPGQLTDDIVERRLHQRIKEELYDSMDWMDLRM